MLKKIIALSLIGLTLAGCAANVENNQETKQVTEVTFADLEMQRWDSTEVYYRYNMDANISSFEGLEDKCKKIGAQAEKYVNAYVNEDYTGLTEHETDFLKKQSRLKGEFQIIKVKTLEVFVYDENTIGAYVGVMANTNIRPDEQLDEEPSVKECLAQFAFIKEEGEYKVQEFSFRDNNGQREIFSPDTAYYDLDGNDRIWKISRGG